MATRPGALGIGSSAATGWPATDWIEGVVLRTSSLEDYDRWTSGELKFDSPQVKKAAEQVGAIWLERQDGLWRHQGDRLDLVRRRAGEDVRRSAAAAGCTSERQLHHLLLPEGPRVEAANVGF